MTEVTDKIVHHEKYELGGARYACLPQLRRQKVRGTSLEGTSYEFRLPVLAVATGGAGTLYTFTFCSWYFEGHFRVSAIYLTWYCADQQGVYESEALVI